MPLCHVSDYDDDGTLKDFIKKNKVIIHLNGESNSNHFLRDDIALDTAASENIFNDKKWFYEFFDLNPIFIEGIGSETHSLYSCSGGKTPFGTAYYVPKAITNVLSFGKCVDARIRPKYSHRNDTFTLYNNKKSACVFKRKGETDLYLWDRNSVLSFILLGTVSERMKKYTKREVSRAELAREYIKRLGYVTPAMLVKLLNSGMIKHTEISSHDVVRCRDIFGPDLGNVRGKTTDRKPKPVVDEVDFLIIQQDQVCSMDLMYTQTRTNAFCVCVFEPSGYIAVRKAVSRHKNHLLSAIISCVKSVTKTGCKVTTLRCDGETAIDTEWMEHQLGDLGIKLDTTSGSEAVGNVERAIRAIKERARSSKSMLPFRPCQQLLEQLVYNVVYFLNCMPSSNTVDGRSARTKLFGRSIDAKTDMRFAFGDYVQVKKKTTTNQLTSRTADAIALLPAGTLDGSWWFYVIKNQTVVRRPRATPMPMPELIIQELNSIAANEGQPDNDNVIVGNWNMLANDDNDNVDERSNDLNGLRPPVFISPNHNAVEDVNIDIDTVTDSDVSERNEAADAMNDSELLDDIFGADTDDDDDEVKENDLNLSGEDINIPADEVNLDEETTPIANLTPVETPLQSYNLRPRQLAQGTWAGAALAPVKRFSFHLTIAQAIKEYGQDAVESVVKELMQLVQMGTFEGVNVNELTPDKLKLIIPSSSFVKAKYTADGAFEKLKTRLVAGGHRQDRLIYDNGASPTAATSSVFMIAALAANENRAVATVDFPGAFLNSFMPDDSPPIYMRLNRYETKVLTEIDHCYKNFICSNGTVVVKLKRGLYGCIESARLWYDTLRNDLEQIGFIRNPHDMCVFNRTEHDNTQTTIVVHVDDLLISGKSEKHLDKVIDDIQCIYKSLSIQRGRVHNYIGMVFDFSDVGKCKVTMDGYVHDLLESYSHITGVAKTPAVNELFLIHDNIELLSDKQRMEIHTLTAKLLYLSKRVRPDLLTAISFLSRRVLKPTAEDLKKLHRVIRYLRHTQTMGIVLQPDIHLQLYGYVDASYGVHSDMKSHTGVIIGIGKGPIYAKSTTQRLNTKSSTEAELVALSDSTGQVLWTRNFLLEQGYNLGPATVYQDNMATISLVKNGKSNSERTRHIAIRFFFVKDKVDKKEIKIQYLQTGNMLADLLTKPLQGHLFERLRNALLNWYY